MSLIKLLPDFVKVKFSELDDNEMIMKQKIEECKFFLEKGYRYKFNQRLGELNELLGLYKGEYLSYFCGQYERLKDEGRY